jgi:hypothetical protein
LVVGVLVSWVVVSADDSAANEWFAELYDNWESTHQDTGGDLIQEIEGGGSGQTPFEEYNQPPDLAGGQQTPQEPVSHPICPERLGNLTLEVLRDVQVTNGMHYVQCRYVENLYMAGYYQTYLRASFTLAWVEKPGAGDTIMKQLCIPSYLGWGQTRDNGKVASVTDTYLHDDMIFLMDQFLEKLNQALDKVEARALACPGRTSSPVQVTGAGSQGLAQDAVWERVKEKCNRPTNTKPDFTVEEFLTYLQKVEEANPDANWKQILTALHADEFAVDLNRELPLTNKMMVFQLWLKFAPPAGIIFTSA